MKEMRFRILAFTAALLALMTLAGCGKQAEPEPQSEDQPSNNLVVGYAEGVTAVEDPDAFAKAMDKMLEDSKGYGISLEYKAVAYSDNGTDFSCYFANAAENQYDMFIAIYGDDALTDELFLSGLLRPGTAFDHITLNRALPPGVTNCTVAFTQVEVVDGQQAIHDQSLIGVEFHVTE